MSKPNLAEEFPDDCDLAEHWIDEAYEHIKQDNGYYVLRIASQQMGLAAAMKLDRPYTIDIDFLYEPDEWSLHWYGFDNKSHEPKEKIMWSPGA